MTSHQVRGAHQLRKPRVPSLYLNFRVLSLFLVKKQCFRYPKIHTFTRDYFDEKIAKEKRKSNLSNLRHFCKRGKFNAGIQSSLIISYLSTEMEWTEVGGGKRWCKTKGESE